MDFELDALKRLPIEPYALSLGYWRDSEKSSRTTAVLRNADHDKLIVTSAADGRYVYKSLRDDQDRGTILDFIMRRLGVNLGQARQELRAWATLPSHTAQEPDWDLTGHCPVAAREEPDRGKALDAWNAAQPDALHGYLRHRGLPDSTLTDARFADCWRRDIRGNAVFPHHDAEGLCGYELRNRDFKGFGSRTLKGLWESRNARTCARLVVCESPIDSLAHHALHVDSCDAIWPLGYVALGGGLSHRQRGLLAALVEGNPAEIVIATDNDAAGDQCADAIAALCVTHTRARPVSKDWCADLNWCRREES